MKTDPEINFATSADGARIAYSINGQGPVMVKAANWLSHIEFDMLSPVWKHWHKDLSKHNTLVRYDERGCGLSDRDVDDLSFESWVDDLETVVDSLGLDRFPLLGVSQGGAVAIAYAVRHPEKVSHLILYGAYGRGRLVRDKSAAALQEAATMNNLIKLGWGREHDAFRQVFSSQFMPGATLEQLQAFNELQRISCSTENAVRFLDEFNKIDVMEMATQVKCPTLVLHARGDLRVSFDEGRVLAAQIPGARFAPLDSSNHVLLSEPAWDVFMSKVKSFLAEQPQTSAFANQLEPLTKREHDVLNKIAQGLDNSSIAETLGLQEKTVRNHITHIFDKLGLKTRAQAIILARDAGMGKNTIS
jgi:pimeloyl-ACP methyl ester carboxylesterase/DNA-binding CsgD family transcriptional regulator